MLVKLLMILNMDLEMNILKMVICLKVNIVMANQMVKVNINGIMEIIIRVNFKMD